MSQIRDKKAHRKHIATMTPINAKSVQLIELHAFAYCLLSVSLSESFDFLKNQDGQGVNNRRTLRISPSIYPAACMEHSTIHVLIASSR